MSYAIIAKSGRIEKDFFAIINSLNNEEQDKTWHTLRNHPKGSEGTHWTIKKVDKDIWQLDLPRGYRLEYTVIDQTVIVLFAGNHDDAAAFLRGKK